MRKTKSVTRAVAPKRKRSPKDSARALQGAPHNFAEYLATVPPPARDTLKQLRATIRSVVPPAASETISYRIPAFRHDGILVWFAAFSDHCSLFPTASIIEAFQNELKNFSTSKGTIQFPLDKPFPAALIKKIVKARVQQHRRKKL